MPVEFFEALYDYPEMHRIKVYMNKGRATPGEVIVSTTRWKLIDNVLKTVEVEFPLTYEAMRLLFTGGRIDLPNNLILFVHDPTEVGGKDWN